MISRVGVEYSTVSLRGMDFKLRVLAFRFKQNALMLFYISIVNHIHKRPSLKVLQIRIT